MSRHLTELESILQQLLEEYRRLLVLLDTQQKAMTKFDVKGMADEAGLQETSRQRVNVLEKRRRAALTSLARELRAPEPLTLKRIAALLPPRAPALLALRADLQAVISAVETRATVSGRLAGAVLGHLNTAFRLFSGAVGKAGLYTRSGIPRVAGRIGVIEAIG